ncbi:uncharacterized protein F5147DRAFT_747547 [Suillus discolor]|uniref:Uncharacterized protein n=1 Tax=Suillus discolor TaxID=1912936 RepID=A0A9P7JQ37_9AGAM|nr:uncharacterized protein F5147DRAFT_747547 [Suillus discolor]KAG2096721.1 hypothetical protein F5147DRAFT_747547 [Suillus discolor]
MPFIVPPDTTHFDLNTFKTEYHPNACHEPVIEHFSAFRHVEANNVRPHVDDEALWTPFKSRADFEFAEIAHQATLNKDQTDRLLKLVWRIVNGNTNFTLRSHTELLRAWDLAASQMTPFEKYIIPVQHKKEVLEFDMHVWPLWDWAMDMLSEPLLAPHFVWDMQHLYKHDRTDYKCFIHEPWTADHWWHIQSSLPSNGAPFAIILYADKTHLSSSGAVKGYPIIARCANLPVPEDSGEDGKLSYTNLKCVVWHESFFKLLESIILYAKMGFMHECVMVLIWGTNCHCPCPVCLIPATKLYDHTMTYPLWTAEEVQAHNVFWRVLNSDPHGIISQDSLHLWHMGLFGRHKFEDLKKRVENLGCEALKKVDDQWQILYASHNILTHSKDRASYALLQCITSYLELDMYILLDVHTTDTIATREAELLVYQKLLERTKNWNFPKVHSGRHIFRDVLEKGASLELHPIKCAYLRQTNHKDVANQLLKLDHISLVSELIHSCINHLNKEHLRHLLSERELKDDENETKDDQMFAGHIHLGSPQSPIGFDLLHEHRYLKVNYESFIDWKLATDYLRCNPSFYGHEWRDCTLIRSHNKDGNDRNIFYVVSEQTLDLALVQPMDSLLSTRCTADRDLRFTRLHARPTASSEFISLHSIIHGALLVPSYDSNTDFFVVDYVDTDMFLHSRRKFF